MPIFQAVSDVLEDTELFLIEVAITIGEDSFNNVSHSCSELYAF